MLMLINKSFYSFNKLSAIKEFEYNEKYSERLDRE